MITSNYLQHAGEILVGCYGSCNPEVLLQRTGIVETVETFTKESFVGVYKYTRHELSFEKRLSDGTAAANIKFTSSDAFVNMFVWALPIQSMKSGGLIRAEGSPPIGEFRIDAHYNIASNMFVLEEQFLNPKFKDEPLMRGNSIPAYSAFYFDAGQSYLNKGLSPSAEYLERVRKGPEMIASFFPEVLNFKNVL